MASVSPLPLFENFTSDDAWGYLGLAAFVAAALLWWKFFKRVESRYTHVVKDPPPAPAAAPAPSPATARPPVRRVPEARRLLAPGYAADLARLDFSRLIVQDPDPIPPDPPPPRVVVLFSPAHGQRSQMFEYLASAVLGAKKSIWVLAYLLNSEEFVSLLILAVERQRAAKAPYLDVRVLVQRRPGDRNLERSISRLNASGIVVRCQAPWTFQHNKVIIIDRAVVGTGSANFTDSAFTENCENMVWIHDPVCAKKFADYFLRLLSFTFWGPSSAHVKTSMNRHIPTT